MKLLSLEQGEIESNQQIQESQRSVGKSWFNNVDLQRVKEQNKKIDQLKFFETQNYGFKEIIRMFEGESSVEKVGKVKKIKKFQPKQNNEGEKRKEKMNKNRMLKKIAMEDILGLIGEL